MRVLIVSYYFPPAGGGGVQRVLSWCRHLPEHGIDVTVLAPHEPHWVDHDTTLVVPAGVRVIRTADRSHAAIIPREAMARARGAARVATWLKLQRRRWTLPDIHRGWASPAVHAALAAGGGPWDVIISSSPPETTHLVASELARRTRTPWVADFRDSWLDLPHLRLDHPAVRLKHQLNVRLAQRALREASAATTVSEPVAADLRRRHPALDCHVLENGIELNDVRRAHARAAGFRDSGRFVVAYTGNFFGRQNATSFLSGVERALEQEPSLARDLLVRFVGRLKPDDHERLAALIARGVAEHVAFLRHDDVLAQQRAADLLLLYVAPGRGSEGVFTGKVFEYVAARRPVLALTPADNVATRLLAAAGATTGSGGARVDPDDATACMHALIEAWNAWRAADGEHGGATPDIDVPAAVLERIDRRQSTAQLAQLLRAVVSRP